VYGVGVGAVCNSPLRLAMLSALYIKVKPLQLARQRLIILCRQSVVCFVAELHSYALAWFPDFDSVLFWFWNHETGRHSTSFRLLHWTGHQRRALHLMVECRLNFENQSSHLGKKRGVRGKAQHYGASAYILWNFRCGFVNQTIITK